MNKKTFKFSFVFLISVFSVTFLNASNWDMYSIDKNVFIGNIIFPKAIKTLPQVSLYRRGTKIKTENDNSRKKIQFTISEDRGCRTFFLLIAKSIMPDVEENTVKYLTIDPSEDYKFYELRVFTEHELSINPVNKKEEIREVFCWNIQKRKMDADGIIPDDTLIIMLNPNHVDNVISGSSPEFPKIIIKESIFKNKTKEARDAEEKKLHEECNELLLASIDLGTLHTNTTSKIKPEYKKKLVVAMADPE